MRIRYDRFPGGKNKALTLSFDDGREYDRRLVSMFNEYGLKGTFHLNSGFLGKDKYVERSEIATLYKGHEISAHTVDHPFLEMSPPDQVVRELMEDREALEELAGYPVRGMSYPFGTWNDRVVGLLPAAGIEYARTTKSHGTYDMPDNFLLWNPTCHHKQMVDHARQFIDHNPRHTRMRLLYVWGHSYEFENDGNWELVERFGEAIGGRDDIWYATNAEIADYVRALNQLRFSVSCRLIHNPSATPVWVSAENDTVEIPGGATISLA